MTVGSAADAEKAWRWARDAGMVELVAETRLVGEEISIECFSVDGRHISLAATTKEVTERFVEVGHAVPADLSAYDLARCNELVAGVLDEAGVRWGPSHTEVILTESGPEIVESHCRRGGNHINELVRLVYGVDMEELLFQHAPGWEISLHGQPDALGAAAVRWFGAGAGLVVAVHGVDEVAMDARVSELDVPAPGRRSHGLRWSGDYVGHLITRGATAREAMEAATALEGKIGIVVEPESPAEDDAAVTRAATDLMSLLNP